MPSSLLSERDPAADVVLSKEWVRALSLHFQHIIRSQGRLDPPSSIFRVTPSDTVPPKAKRKHERGATWNIRFEALLHTVPPQPALSANAHDGVGAPSRVESVHQPPANTQDPRSLFSFLKVLVYQCQLVADQGRCRLQEEQRSTSHLRLQAELQRVRDDLSAAMKGWAADKEAIIKLHRHDPNRWRLASAFEQHTKEVERGVALQEQLNTAQTAVAEAEKQLLEARRLVEQGKVSIELLRKEIERCEADHKETVKEVRFLERSFVENFELRKTLQQQSLRLERLQNAQVLEQTQNKVKVIQLQKDLDALQAVQSETRRKYRWRKKQLFDAQNTRRENRQRISELEQRAIASERQLTMFHFGVKLLDSCFLIFLKEQMISRIPPNKKRKRGEHDLWDVQVAVKALLDKCEDHVNSIRDQFDFYEEEDLVGTCPMCHEEHG
ncbi:hypothetical protein NLJ89_g566 [Agrocybe chaxingu]|uniref:Uncharacterized protein n=1 Tax=Agrocybe chaxingu TaxID=84603 RepID=A0A9W8TGC6_9AGAR|nr:hypothetical protein NLJ89_g566 [Agrocybe chaxingu]